MNFTRTNGTENISDSLICNWTCSHTRASNVRGTITWGMSPPKLKRRWQEWRCLFSLWTSVDPQWKESLCVDDFISSTGDGVILYLSVEVYARTGEQHIYLTTPSIPFLISALHVWSSLCSLTLPAFEENNSPHTPDFMSLHAAW